MIFEVTLPSKHKKIEVHLLPLFWFPYIRPYQWPFRANTLPFYIIRIQSKNFVFISHWIVISLPLNMIYQIQFYEFHFNFFGVNLLFFWSVISISLSAIIGKPCKVLFRAHTLIVDENERTSMKKRHINKQKLCRPKCDF